jgi:hypothetical protein
VSRFGTTFFYLSLPLSFFFSLLDEVRGHQLILDASSLSPGTELTRPVYIVKDLVPDLTLF